MFSAEGTYSLRDGRDPREEFGTVPALEDCKVKRGIYERPYLARTFWNSALGGYIA